MQPSDNVKVNVVYFAQAREFAGTGEEEISLSNPVDLHHLLSELIGSHPKLASMERLMRIMVNGQQVPQETKLKNADRIAVIFPVSGG